jgi:hypothetical protein
VVGCHRNGTIAAAPSRFPPINARAAEGAAERITSVMMTLKPSRRCPSVSLSNAADDAGAAVAAAAMYLNVFNVLKKALVVHDSKGNGSVRIARHIPDRETRFRSS